MYPDLHTTLTEYYTVCLRMSNMLVDGSIRVIVGPLCCPSRNLSGSHDHDCTLVYLSTKYTVLASLAAVRPETEMNFESGCLNLPMGHVQTWCSARLPKMDRLQF
jgi:hypothetical protein